MKQKDNLTDVVEHLPKVPTSSSPQSNNSQQVLNPMGELITLGQNNAETLPKNIQGSSIELPVEQIKQAITAAFDNFSERHSKKQKPE